MTKKELTLDALHSQEIKSYDWLGRIATMSGVKYLSKVYSRLLDEKVSTRRTLKLVHAQIAMGLLLLLGGISLVVALFLCAWAVLAVWQCRM